MVARWVAVAGVLGLTAVAAGAFGAHALKTRLEPRDLQAYETAVRYQMIHALALVGLAWWMTQHPSSLTRAAAFCMVLGVVAFSGSIYALVLTHWRWLGPVTPAGGLLMMIGWLLWIVSAIRRTGAVASP